MSRLRAWISGCAALGIAGFTWAATPAISEVRIVVKPEAASHLDSRPRDLVPARVEWNGTNHPSAQLRLKGSKGSFRPLADRPGFTVVLEVPPQIAGQDTRRSVHLNNSVEDPSRLQEALAAECFREAGVPAPEVRLARVMFNGRSLGLYVMVEAVDATFLHRAFPDRPVRSFGEDDSLPSLDRLQIEPDSERRWQRFRDGVDVSECVSYLAVESLLGHRDGYLAARNNFRLVEHGSPARLALVPHGMDQVVGSPEFPWNPAPGGILATLLMAHPDGRRLLAERVRELHVRFGDEAAWMARLDRLAAMWLASLNRDEAVEVLPAVSALRDRLRARARGVSRQLALADSDVRIGLQAGEARRLDSWTVELLGPDPQAGGEVEPAGTNQWLHAQLSGDTAVVWRTVLHLAPGAYRFEGRVRTRDLVPMSQARRQGAGLRIAGEEPGKNRLVGTQPWTVQEAVLEVPEPPSGSSTQVDLLCEVRGRSGEAWFDLDSLIIRRIR